MMKKTLTLFLALLLVFCLCPVAYADPVLQEGTEASPSQEEGVIDGSQDNQQSIDNDRKQEGRDITDSVVEDETLPSNEISDEQLDEAADPDVVVEPMAAATSVNNGAYIIKSALGTVVDISGASMASAANAQLYASNNSPAQRFYVASSTGGTYTIKNTASAKYLDVAGAAAKSGTNVWQYASNNSSAQKWHFVDTGDGDGSFYIVSALSSDLCLDVYGGSKANGANLQIWKSNKSTAQKFYLVSQKSTINTGYYTVNSGVGANKVLDISGASASDGGNADIWQSNNTTAQRFFIQYNSQDGYYTIYNVSSNKVLEVQWAQTNNGANVWQYAWNGTAAQKWSIESAGNNKYLLRSGCSGKVLDVTGASSANGANVQVYQSNNSAAQQWSFTETKPIDEGVFNIKSALGKVLDAMNGASVNGTKIQTYTSNGSFAQKYQLKYVGDGYYNILAVNSNMALDVRAGGTADGTVVQLYAANSTLSSQLWKPVGAGGGYFYFMSKCNGKVLDIYGGSSANNAPVQMYGCNGTNAQRFTLQGTPVIADGTYTIASALKSDMVLDVEGGSTADGAAIQIYTSNNTSAQKFTIKHVGSGYYTIVSLRSNKALDVVNSAINSSTGLGAVQQWATHGGAAQKWKAHVSGSGYFSFSSAVGAGTSYLDVYGAGTSDGTKICVYKGNNSAAQKFSLSSTSGPTYQKMSITLDQMTSYQMTNQWVTASYAEVKNTLNPSSYSESSSAFYQFADIRSYGRLSADQLNSYIASTSNGRSGKLNGMGYAFVAAAKQYGLDETYLLAHAILESGWGTSELAKGYYYSGGVIDGKSYPAGTYYNFYGIGAVDSGPLNGGRKLAIINGWNSPEKAITGAAQWIAVNYVYRSEYSQPTLYHMKWDYERSSDTKAYGWHQYATGITWPTSIANIMGNCYNHAGVRPTFSYIVPRYA